MKLALPLFLFVTGSFAGFTPNVRVDHQNRYNHHCYNVSIAVGPGAPPIQPVYVVFQDDTLLPVSPARRSDVLFQRSTDLGRTWLNQDVVVRQGSKRATYPGLTTDRDGGIYVVYNEEDYGGGDRFECVRSTNGGASWTEPVRVDDNATGAPGGRARIAVDTAGNLVCAWNDARTGMQHVRTSVSTDHGTTWSSSVRVCQDTIYHHDCYISDVCVQPGTNDYFVAVEGSYLFFHANLFRSTDMGQTFVQRVQVDTFEWQTGNPYVVADSEYVICDYTGQTSSSPLQSESRTLHTPSGTWGPCTPLTDLDTTYQCYYSGKLAISPDRMVHATLMVGRIPHGNYHVYYTSSSDHGSSWSSRMLVDDDSVRNKMYPDIAVDANGHAYLAWQDNRNHRDEVWFATNAPAAIAGQPMLQPISVQPSATIVRGVLVLGGNGDSPSEREDARYSPHFPAMSRAALLDISGREVLELHPGANDVRTLAPGVYFVRSEPSAAGHEPSSITKVVVAR